MLIIFDAATAPWLPCLIIAYDAMQSSLLRFSFRRRFDIFFDYY